MNICSIETGSQRLHDIMGWTKCFVTRKGITIQIHIQSVNEMSHCKHRFLMIHGVCYIRVCDLLCALVKVNTKSHHVGAYLIVITEVSLRAM